MTNHLDVILNNFISQGEKRLSQHNTNLEGLKRVFENDMTSMRELLKTLVKITNEEKFGTATMHAATIEYDMKAGTATVRQAVTVNETQYYMNFFMDNEKTVVDNKEFEVGSQDSPYAYIKAQFDNWLRRDFVSVPFKA